MIWREPSYVFKLFVTVEHEIASWSRPYATHFTYFVEESLTTIYYETSEWTNRYTINFIYFIDPSGNFDENCHDESWP